LKTKLEFVPIISTNYTLNLGEGNYHNELAHTELVKWRSSDFIDIMVEQNYPIVISPYTLDAKCQFRSKYSLKVFSNGTVGACAMSFFDKDNPTLSDVIANIDDLGKYWKGAKDFHLFSDVQCKNCSSLFLCGGTFKIPCVKSMKLKECTQKDYLYIDLKLFLKRYLKYCKAGKDELFVGFNECENYK
jgi:radical SAM protein with 4Fe4S-binding SPASM domain